ncbi:MAG TPA: PDZ domain-containing protein [Planctomycetota bacterium]|nr:PDZ domain-containing protein [Planctomycetota bacterium]
MDQFVCVRVVQAWGMDLSIFQFDWRLTWAVFFMSGDKTVYGRFSPRQQDDVEGLRKALEGALELHKKYPANKDELAGKKGIPLPWKAPEEMPAISEKGKFQPAEGKKGCIHCHNVQEGAAKSFKQAGMAVPDRFFAPYPTPQRVGFMLEARDQTRIIDITQGWPAAKAGLQVGDRIVRFGGQPILSIADVQWVLWSSADTATIPVEVDRGGQKVESALALPAGWRTR